MMLIAESGSTKTDWVLVDNNSDVKIFKTIGFNPFFHSSDFIKNEILLNVNLIENAKHIKNIFFYGAGCSSEKMNNVVKLGLSMVFENANILVDHDLLACALATYSGEPSISCILGTGSNSCFYDGNKIREEIPSIAYVLGDEGSGAYYGKKLLRDYLYNQLPLNISKDLENELKVSKSSIFENVYSKPNANVYLASFMRFISNHYDSEYVSNMIYNGMSEFIKIHVCCYPEHKAVKTHFIGSISKIFEIELYKAAKDHNINVGEIIRKPVENLVRYHLNKYKILN
jgi:N-acetylglucosamine kinase-like BadF-type ATPase